MRRIALLILPLAFLAGCKSPTKLVVYSNTNLEIDQPIRQLEEVLSTIDAQQDLNFTIANISFLYGVKLHLIFEGYLATLPENDQPAAILEQEKWQIAHDKKVEMAYAEFEGGTYAPYAAGEAAIKGYKARINEIEGRMMVRSQP